MQFNRFNPLPAIADSEHGNVSVIGNLGKIHESLGEVVEEYLVLPLKSTPEKTLRFNLMVDDQSIMTINALKLEFQDALVNSATYQFNNAVPEYPEDDWRSDSPYVHLIQLAHILGAREMTVFNIGRLCSR